MTEEISEEKKRLMDELFFYLSRYKKLAARSASMKKILDREINELVEKIKRIN